MSDPNGPQEQPVPDTDAARSAWDDVGSHLSNLGQHVRERFEQTAEATRAGAGREGDSVRRWIDTLDDAFTSLGDAVRDPTFRREAESSVERLADALGGTLSELGEQLQRRFGGGAPQPSGAGAAEPPPEPSPTDVGAPEPPAGPSGTDGGEPQPPPEPSGTDVGAPEPPADDEPPARA